MRFTQTCKSFLGKSRVPQIKGGFNHQGQTTAGESVAPGGLGINKIRIFNNFTVCVIIINKKYRDRGIGKKLINAAIRESKKLYNKEKLILSCFSTNERALNLYKKIGFNVIGIRKKQYFIESEYHDEVLMELFISDYNIKD